MKKWLLGIAIISFLVAMLVCGWAATLVEQGAAAGRKSSEHQWIAFSLKVLQQRLQANPQESQQNRDIKHLAGITQIHGYVVDEANNDLILFGERDPNLPLLYLEDFVVALRNAMHKYTTQQGDTSYYHYPGCSIDPDPQVLSQLRDVSRRISELTHRNASQEEINREFQNWHQTCRMPQAVRVMGIPYDTRFAWVMVKADYDMKQLVDGSDTLEIEGFDSLTGMTMDLAREDIIANRRISVPLASMNRFWFHPGPNRYKEDVGVVEITWCPVILLTEEEHLTKTGKIKGKGAPDPLAHQFAQDFSCHYNEIAGKRPIYSELKGLFRFVALAKIIKFKGAEKEAGLDLSYLLDQYEVPDIQVPKQLPGRSHIPEFEYSEEIKGRHRYIKLWLPSCGGVIIEMNVTPSMFIIDKGGTLKIYKNNIIRDRKSPEELFWIIPPHRQDDVRIQKDECQLAFHWSKN